MCKGFQRNERDRIKIKAFYIHLSVLSASKSLPDSLTLCFLPRINGSPLDINDSSIRPDSHALITLHLVASAEKVTRGAIFGSKERVMASDGARFEVFLRDEKVLKGVFRKDGSDKWRMDCKRGLERSTGEGVEVKEAGVCVLVEGAVEAMSERVGMVVQRRKRERCFVGLEEIPEERELETAFEGVECCSRCGEEGEEMGPKSSHSEDYEMESEKERAEMEAEMEGVRWAVDLGIWVMSLGVGILVSRASSKGLRRSRLL